METLSSLKCIPCSGKEQPLLKEGIENYRKQISPEWQILKKPGKRREIDYLYQSFRFKLDDKKAWEFCNKVAELAISEGHHPILTWNYDTIKIDLFTHKIEGLHRNDFVMAARIDKIYNSTA